MVPAGEVFTPKESLVEVSKICGPQIYFYLNYFNKT